MSRKYLVDYKNIILGSALKFSRLDMLNIVTNDIEKFELELNCSKKLEYAIANKREVILVLPTNVGGTIYHYNHSFGALILPFLDYGALGVFDSKKLYLTEECGPMNAELIDVAKLLNISIVTTDKATLAFLLNPDASFIGMLNKIILPAYDYYWVSGYQPPKSTIKRVRNYLIEKAGIDRKIKNQKVLNEISIVLVNRKPAQPFYKNLGRSSGAERRSIPNIHIIKERLETDFDSVKIVEFENKSLLDKVSILMETDIVILQHGAALTSLYWLNPSSYVIEILPKDLVKPKSNIYDFSPAGLRAAELAEVEYIRFVTENDHASVDPTILASMCQGAAKLILAK